MDWRWLLSILGHTSGHTVLFSISKFLYVSANFTYCSEWWTFQSLLYILFVPLLPSNKFFLWVSAGRGFINHPVVRGAKQYQIVVFVSATSYNSSGTSWLSCDNVCHLSN